MSATLNEQDEYRVLARRWRPRTFDELVGQEHIVQALVNGLKQGRVHHAFLFTGTRGVGKTTVARILAKCLNCETGVTHEPCGECQACRDIDENRFVDLLEVDAASRTKVDDTREILDNVQYAPTRGRYKVYLVDEVHMLSMNSFNALLKTLEEPPPHVKFILATTDPQKVPVTILSRCLRFNLRRMQPQQIEAYLREQLGGDDVEIEDGALELLARAADGSMRDGLSLVDQALAHGGGALKFELVRSMLGTVEQRFIQRLLEGLRDSDGEVLLGVASDIVSQGQSAERTLEQLARALHEIALVQMVPDYSDPGATDAETWREFARSMEPEDVQLFYQIAINGQRDMKLAPDPRSGLDMTLLRMLAFRPAESGDGGAKAGDDSVETATASAGARAGAAHAGHAVREDSAETTVNGAGAAPAGGTRQQTQSADRQRSAPESATPAAEPRPVSRPTGQAPSPPATAGAPGNGQSSPDAVPVADNATAARSLPSVLDWHALCAGLGLGGPVKVLAEHLAPAGVEDRRLELQIERQDQHLQSERQQEALRQALSEYFDCEVEVRIRPVDRELDTPARRDATARGEREASAREAIHNDATVAALCETFDARIIPGSIKPLESP